MIDQGFQPGGLVVDLLEMIGPSDGMFAGLKRDMGQGMDLGKGDNAAMLI